jgi:hypothetical protein
MASSSGCALPLLPPILSPHNQRQLTTAPSTKAASSCCYTQTPKHGGTATARLAQVQPGDARADAVPHHAAQGEKVRLLGVGLGFRACARLANSVTRVQMRAPSTVPKEKKHGCWAGSLALPGSSSWWKPLQPRLTPSSSTLDQPGAHVNPGTTTCTLKPWRVQAAEAAAIELACGLRGRGTQPLSTAGASHLPSCRLHATVASLSFPRLGFRVYGTRAPGFCIGTRLCWERSVHVERVRLVPQTLLWSAPAACEPCSLDPCTARVWGV